MRRENLRLALWLWLAQLLLALACAFGDWTHLSLWDSMWYRHIVDHGYSDTLTPGPYQGGNVGFFPGYPLLGWLFKTIFQVSTDAGLLFASSFAALFAWAYFAELLDLRGVPHKRGNLLWMWLYPFSFFFVAAYSDSLTAATVLGFILFSERWLQAVASPAADAGSAAVFTSSAAASPAAPISPSSHPSRAWLWFSLAALHGFGMTFNRLLNTLFVLYPVIRALQLHSGVTASATASTISSRTVIARASSLAMISAGGMASFFAYCAARFGAWNFYFITEHRIWGWSGSVFQWDKLLPPVALFDFSRPFRGDTVGRYVTIFFGVYFCCLLADLIRRRRFREPIAALFLVGGMFWGAYLLGRSTWGFTGMGRYLIPLWLLFLTEWRVPGLPGLEGARGWNRVAWAVFALAMLILQVVYAAMFARNGWVA